MAKEAYLYILIIKTSKIKIMATQRAQEAKKEGQNGTTNATATATPTPAGVESTGADAAAGDKKEKAQRLFGGNSNFSALKKAQGEVDAKYNRIGRKLKGLELDQEDEAAIVEILKKSHAKASQEAFSKATSGEASGTEQFV